jgi:hypothetical protein
MKSMAVSMQPIGEAMAAYWLRVATNIDAVFDLCKFVCERGKLPFDPSRGWVVVVARRMATSAVARWIVRDSGGMFRGHGEGPAFDDPGRAG